MSIAKGIAYSPRTQLTAELSIDGVSAVLDNIAVVPALGAEEYAYIVMSKTKNFMSDDPADYETIKFTTVTNETDTISGFTRQQEGTAQIWPIGTWCACTMTDKHLLEIVAELATKLEAADITGKLDLAGGTMTGPVDFAGEKITDPLIEGYAEQNWAQSHTIAGTLTLDVEAGNVQLATISANVTAVAITNAPAGETTSLTLRLLATGTYTYAWLAGTAVISASIGVSASDVDDSFNSAAAFADNLQAGDLITVAGFTAAGNNDVWRVKSATTSKIVVTEEDGTAAGLTTEAAGESITITRHNLYPEGYAEAPDAPTENVPTEYVLWTHDGVRWMISKVGEY